MAAGKSTGSIRIKYCSAIFPIAISTYDITVLSLDTYFTLYTLKSDVKRNEIIDFVE